ncbi:MAG: exodeoxyribonuclease VII large subunit [Euryarchaeota archaeon]|nr:exodeoxyribonuclease VII large subunit [Euryarchaeota archaeon]
MALREPPKGTRRLGAFDATEGTPGAGALSVTEVVVGADRVLRGTYGDVWVRGELSQFKPYRSGHWYFTLKDDRSSLSAVMFSGSNGRVRFEPEDGMEVLVRGRIGVYTDRGSMQFYCEEMEPVGAGALALAYEKLKKKLEAEGLFDPARKKPVPRYPRTIGVVTSTGGAALRDIVHVATRRDPSVRLLVADAVVQGERAAPSIVSALRRLVTEGSSEVILIGRGGGSLEDLWAFNTEAVVRAVATCPIPIVSAVGHETDVALTDFAADLRAATPSAAAETVVADARAMLQRLDESDARMTHVLRTLVPRHEERVKELRHRLDDALRDTVPKLLGLVQDLERRMYIDLEKIIDARIERVITAGERIEGAMVRTLDRDIRSVEHLAARLDALSPLKTVGRGYGLVRVDGRHVRSVEDVRIGDPIDVRLLDGTILASVSEVHKEELVKEEEE